MATKYSKLLNRLLIITEQKNLKFVCLSFGSKQRPNDTDYRMVWDKVVNNKGKHDQFKFKLR